MNLSCLRRLVAAPLLALCATSAVIPASSAQEPGAAEECPGDEAATAPALLATHNAERARLGLPLLAWNCQLERDAAGWAHALLARGALDHAGGEALGGSGENLWMGTAGRYPVERMVGRFIEEGRHYRHGRFPDVSLTGDWADVGHYSQIVWRDTRELGCALAQGAERDVLVCRYRPAGNIHGKVAY